MFRRSPNCNCNRSFPASPVYRTEGASLGRRGMSGDKMANMSGLKMVGYWHRKGWIEGRIDGRDEGKLNHRAQILQLKQMLRIVFRRFRFLK